MSKFLSKSNLRSLSVFEFVGKAGGRGDKVPKVRVVGIVDKGNEYVGAKKGWGQVCARDHSYG